MKDSEYLFSSASWHDVERNQLQEMQKAIAALDGNRLLNTSVEDLVLYFEVKFQIEIPTLLTEEIVVDQRETQIDMSRDPSRYISDRSRPFFIAGTEIEVEIPFTGEAEAFKFQPTTYTLSPPRAEVRLNLLVLKIVGTNLEQERVRSDIDRAVNEIQSHLTTLRGNAQGLRTQLPNQARSAIESRRQKLLGDRNLVGGLGFKMKPRPGTNQTFTAPEIRKKLAPSLPAASTLPYKPEPTLSNADYEHILDVLQNMVSLIGQNVHLSQPRIFDMSILKDSYLPACFTKFPENDNSKVGQAQLEIEKVAINIAMMNFMTVKFFDLRVRRILF